MKNSRLIYFYLVSPGIKIVLLIVPPSRIKSMIIDYIKESLVIYSSFLWVLTSALKVGIIFLMTSTRFLWFLMALKYPTNKHDLMFSEISWWWRSSLQTIKNLFSSRIWHILVSVISFKFLMFTDSDSGSLSFGEVKMKFTGTKKGSKSLKQ